MLATIGSSCGSNNKKKLNKRFSLWRKDKIPYGTYVAYENLKYMFPDAKIKINRKSPDPNKEFSWNTVPAIFSDTDAFGKKAIHLVISESFFADREEMNALVQKAVNGDDVFISAMYYSEEVIDSFKFKTQLFYNIFRDSLTVSLYKPISGDSVSYTYPGSPQAGYLASYDTIYNTVLGRSKSGDPDFIKIHYLNGGSIYFHFAPAAFTNFFLLHKNNMEYYNNVFSYLPRDAKIVYWDDYFRNKKYGDRSILPTILKNDSLRWAFWMVLAIFLLLFLFQSKRRQRMIPVKQPVRNSTLDFVKTVGRLYFQRRDNKNLAMKMSAHFLDHVRTKYNIRTTALDEQFVEKLAFKSGYNKEALQQIVYSVNTLQDHPAFSDEDLVAFSKNLESFYKHS